MAVNAQEQVQRELAKRNVTFTISGMRGVVGEGLTPEVITRATAGFGCWYKELGGHVVVGRDTRLSGPWIHDLVLGTLVACGCSVVDLGVCPTPAIVFTTHALDASGAIIISGSHNPPEWNAIKCLDASHTFLSNEELERVAQFMTGTEAIQLASWQGLGSVESHDALPPYLAAIESTVDRDLIARAPSRVVVDTGAGAGKGVTAPLLERLGCEVRVINDNLLPGPCFPRNFEPIAANLSDLASEIRESGADVGFAHDCDADRVALVSEAGDVYPEDIILALIVKDTLEQLQLNNQQGIIVTNVASSLMFDDLVEIYGGRVVRTPVGERYLASTMTNLLVDLPTNEEVFGGEGSCGGFMLPRVNNARDGILAVIKVVEILARRRDPLSALVAELPHYETTRETLQCPIETSYTLMAQLKESLRDEGVEFSEIDRDVRVVAPQEWVLVHPSNTEPIIRVISEAKTLDRAKVLCSDYLQKLASFS